MTSPTDPQPAESLPASTLGDTSSEAVTNIRGLELSFDDYDADLELAWLGYVLASCQSETHLNVPRPVEYGYDTYGQSAGSYSNYHRMAVSSHDISSIPHSRPFANYARSRSDTCLAPDRCST